jgi:molybdopterin-guanine dinucleotide biosynthesis protein A
MRAAIILAGGKGQRFQIENGTWQDKALAELWGKPLLVHAVESVKDVVDKVVVVINDDSRKTEYGKVLETFGIQNTKIATDFKMNSLSGPLIAIYTGLKSVKAEYYLTVPSDVPMLSQKVADYLFTEIGESYVAVPMWPNGRLETLLMVLERRTCLKIAHVLCRLGRSHPDDIIRGSQKALFISPLGEIKNLDPKLKSFVNINFREDLKRLQPRQGQGSIIRNLRLDLGEPPLEVIPLLLKASNRMVNKAFLVSAERFSMCATSLEENECFFWAALSREQQAKNLLRSSQNANESFLKAAQNYKAEAKIYDQHQCFLLAARAESDAGWCEEQIR